VLILSVGSWAQMKPKQAGIVFRGVYWDTHNGNSIRVREHGFSEEVNVGNYGGSLTFFSRMDNQMFMEFSLSASAHVERKQESLFDEEVDVETVTPVLFGLRYNLLPLWNPSAIQPYASCGVGPYWFHHVHVIDEGLGMDEEVQVDSNMKPGAYAGGGVFFDFADWLSFNFDVRYHFVDFNRNHPKSDFEFGLGFAIKWGHYKPDRYE
jgi:hypothetical protein